MIQKSGEENLKETGNKRRPDLYEYLEYHVFLRDWIQYRKKWDSTFYVQDLAKKSGILRGCRNIVS